MSAGPDDGSDDAAETDDAAAKPATGLRGKDILAVRTSEELDVLEASMDAVERAQLAQWFAKPSIAVVEERQAASDGGQFGVSDAELDREYALRQVAIAEASKHIAPEAIALLERHERLAGTFLREIVPPPAFVDETIIQVRIPSESETATIGELRLYSRDEATDYNLSQSVPQAVLRDLHRPESHYQIQFTSPFFSEDEPPPEDPWPEIRNTMREKRPVPPLVRFYQVSQDARREFRELTSGSWADKVAAAKAAREAL